MSLFFIVDVVDNNDDVFNTADSNNGDDNDKDLLMIEQIQSMQWTETAQTPVILRLRT
jgi:hypothetical protein